VAGVDEVVEVLLAQLLVVALAQGDFEVVDGVGAQAREVVLAEAGVEQHVADEAVILLQVVDVRRAVEDGHLLVRLPAEGGGHRVHGLDDLVVAHRARAALREQRGRQAGDALLAGRVGGRAGHEEEAEGDEGRGARLEHAGDLGRRHALVLRGGRGAEGRGREQGDEECGECLAHQ
jgi:hypothetical protein